MGNRRNQLITLPNYVILHHTRKTMKYRSLFLEQWCKKLLIKIME